MTPKERREKRNQRARERRAEAKRAARWLEVAEREQGYESGLKGAGE